jgi:hypothetical protein
LQIFGHFLTTQCDIGESFVCEQVRQYLIVELGNVLGYDVEIDVLVRVARC